MHIVGPVLKAVGIDIKDITLSASSIYRARKTIRKSIVQNIQETFVPNTPLVAHFDSKILPDTYGNLADRMPIIISGLNVEKLLAIPKLTMGTGELIGNSVVEVLENGKMFQIGWQVFVLTQQVPTLVFTPVQLLSFSRHMINVYFF